MLSWIVVGLVVLIGVIVTSSEIFVLFGDPWDQPKRQEAFGDQSTWSGDGAGAITITERTAEKIVIRMEFTEPMKSLATHTLTIAPSSVTWVMEGHHNFIGRLFDLFINIDKMIGADVEKSLARLKSVAG